MLLAASVVDADDAPAQQVNEAPKMRSTLFARVDEGETADQLVFSPDATLAAAPTGKAIYVWKTSTGQLIRRIAISDDLQKPFGAHEIPEDRRDESGRAWQRLPPTIDFSTDGKSIWAYGNPVDLSTLPLFASPLTLVCY
ncbi:MAG: hypothetical protein KDA41_07410, partial [Planctomycetales bacterium]|nr:hypothetical protein [Planctomycetales bacterium]